MRRFDAPIEPIPTDHGDPRRVAIAAERGGQGRDESRGNLAILIERQPPLKSFVSERLQALIQCCCNTEIDRVAMDTDPRPRQNWSERLQALCCGAVVDD